MQVDMVGQGDILVHGLCTKPRISVSARFISEAVKCLLVLWWLPEPKGLHKLSVNFSQSSFSTDKS